MKEDCFECASGRFEILMRNKGVTLKLAYEDCNKATKQTFFKKFWKKRFWRS